MEQHKETQLVYIKDLLFAVLYRWKTVLAAAVIFALLLGGVSLLTNRGPSPDDQHALTSYHTAKAVYDQRITALEKSLSEQQAHAKDSLLMNLDPYNHYEAHLTILVQPEDPVDGFQSAFSSQSVLEAYRSVVTEENCLAKLAEILQQPAQYVPELLAATVPAMGTDTVTFTVKCADANTATALAEAMETHLLQYRDKISLPHTLSVLKSTTLAISDSTLAETQRSQLNRLAEILTGLTEARNKRNALVSPDVSSAGSISKSALVLAVAGAFVGAFLTACVLWVNHLCSGRIYSGRTLQNHTGIKVLGSLDSGRKRGPIQKWLRKLEGRTAATDPTLLATELSLRAQTGKLLITGNEPQRKALADALRKVMPNGEITEAAGILESPEALKALAACDAVVLVETCGSSLYRTVSRQQEKIDDFGKQLLGCIVVDG